MKSMMFFILSLLALIGLPTARGGNVRGQRHDEKTARRALTINKKVQESGMYSIGNERGGTGGVYHVNDGGVVPNRDRSLNPILVQGYTVWDNTRMAHTLNLGAGVIVDAGGTLVIEGSKEDPVRVVFREDQEIFVRSKGSLKIEHAMFVATGQFSRQGMGVKADQYGNVNISINGLRCKGLRACLSLGTMYNAANITIDNSSFEDCEYYAISGSPGNYQNVLNRDHWYTLKNSRVSNCGIGIMGSRWIIDDTSFVYNGAAAYTWDSDYYRVRFDGNGVGIAKRRTTSRMGEVLDSFFVGNDIGIDRGCELSLTDVTFSGNGIGMNCSQGEWFKGMNQWVETKGIGEMNRVNFLNSSVAIQWSSAEDASLEDSDIYWNSTDPNIIETVILDGADGYGDGGLVLYGSSVDAAYPHSGFPI